MKILHLTSTFYPDSTGGTETYVFQLASNQLKAGNDVGVLRLGDMPSYQYRRLDVHVAETELVNKQAYYGGLKEAPTVVNQLVKLKPDVVYVNDRDPHFSGDVIESIKKLLPKCHWVGVYHSPGQSCPNRSLINQHHNICDGKLITKRCTECRISKTKGGVVGRMVGVLSLETANGNTNPLSEFTHANYFTNRYATAFKKWVNALDTLQYHADWVKDVLLLNGVTEEKLSFFSLEDIYGFHDKSIEGLKGFNNGKIQLVCSGRCTTIKGQLILLEALENLDADTKQKIEVHFIGPGFDDDNDYAQKVRRKMESLPFVLPPKLLKPEDIQGFLSDKHIGIVPSLWPETGPLVILDFLNAGMKVISSPYIGIQHNSIQFYEYKDKVSLGLKIEDTVNMLLNQIHNNQIINK